VKRAVALPLLCALAACGLNSGDKDTDKDIPEAAAAPKVAAPAVESAFGTPVKDRVATIGVLNKRNNLTQDLVLKSGESRRIGNLVVRVSTCERTLPWESPPEIGAFVQVFVEERPQPSQPLAWRKVFSGWLFRNSPSLNAVEHPVYDVWVKDCAMKFPGEDEEAAPSSSAAKPAGKATASPDASAPATPSATASPPLIALPPPVTTPSPDGTE
jgi:hypothetical protein